ncbi:hypothetical protein AWB67_06733 [Caballeronia terrestris]|uniref:Uncharacterized protein n=1 Tax=Caballeronia terrestris TaxID=1226301 RepID=A0A158KVK8_9BURK|nr:hypothetical protein AWB67_06733 [Caballeronia terrestris]
MGFVLSAVIFLTSAGFLVNASLAPTPPEAIVPASTSGSSEGRTSVPQIRPEISEQGTAPSAPPTALPTTRQRGTNA